jgi:hypothetical protein
MNCLPSLLAALVACATPPLGVDPPVQPDPSTPDPIVEPTVPALPNAALPRLSDAQWRASAQDLLAVPYGGPLPADYVLHGHASVGASSISTGPLDLEQYEAAAWFVADASLATPGAREARMGCRIDPRPEAELPAEDALACLRAWAADLSARAWRRPVEVGELDTLTTLAAGLFETDRGLAARAVAAAVLSSPHFLYRVETGVPDRPDAWRYTDHEVAARLALLLTDRGPDAALRAAAEEGALSDPAQVRAQAERLLESPHARDALGRFWRELFQLDQLFTTAKDPTLFPELDDALRSGMAQELERLMLHLTLDEDADVRSMFTTRTTFVDGPLAALYGLPPVARTTQTEVDAERGGVLGRAALATVFSHPTLTSPTRRGKLIRTRLLCQSVEPPPPGVLASVDALPDGGTLRDRLEQHASATACRSCHDDIDPPGYGMEQLDPIGRLRTLDNGLPIDASGELDGAAFHDLAGLGRAVADHPELPGCLALDLWRHATGQAETDAQLAAVDDLATALTDAGMRWRELLLTLLSSDSFLRLRPGEVSAPAERCDGVDNDGDDEVDEVVRACATEHGPGVEACAAGAWTGCAPVPASTGPLEVCNQQDDDHDGQIDEDLAIALTVSAPDELRAAHEACDVDADPLSGPCQAAIHRQCASSGCAVTGYGPVTDDAAFVCLSGDRAAVVPTTFTTLASHHPDCFWWEAHSPACNAAIHRFCASSGQTTGFGPVEHSGDTAVVVCTPRAEVIETSYTVAATHQPLCNGATDRWRQPCRAAFHDLCRARGALTGHGPLENSGDVAYVACLYGDTP